MHIMFLIDSQAFFYCVPHLRVGFVWSDELKTVKIFTLEDFRKPTVFSSVT